MNIERATGAWSTSGPGKKTERPTKTSASLAWAGGQGNLCHECHREWRRGGGEAKTSVERTHQRASVKFLTGRVEGAVEASNSATRG